MNLLPTTMLGKLLAAVVVFLLVVLVVVLGLWWLRHDAKQDAHNQDAVQAAQQQEAIQHDADARARAAQRDGLYERLRAGTYFAAPLPDGDAVPAGGAGGGPGGAAGAAAEAEHRARHGR